MVPFAISRSMRNMTMAVPSLITDSPSIRERMCGCALSYFISASTAIGSVAETSPPNIKHSEMLREGEMSLKAAPSRSPQMMRNGAARNKI